MDNVSIKWRGVKVKDAHREHTDNDETSRHSLRFSQSEEHELLWTPVKIACGHKHSCPSDWERPQWMPKSFLILCTSFIWRPLHFFDKSHPFLYDFKDILRWNSH